MKKVVAIILALAFSLSLFTQTIAAVGNDYSTNPLSTIEESGKKVVQVSLGGYHSAAITEDGCLYMWGFNCYGQLGNGTTEDSYVPTKIMDNVTFVSLGRYHSAALTIDGSLYMWGYNDYGQLGNGITKDSYIPIKIMDNVAAVSLGYYNSAAITTDGSLYTWGQNTTGQLGNGRKENRLEASYLPEKIIGNVASISLGSEHGAAITVHNDLYMWGDNFFGQLGDGTSEDSYVPMKIMDNVVSVSLGNHHSAAITTDSSLYMWGDGYYGQLGNGESGLITESHVPIKIMDNVISVRLGIFHSAAITADGSLYMWGDNSRGQLGNGTYEFKNLPIKIMDGIVFASLGWYHSSAITTNGSLYMWGNNDYGQLGNGTTENSSVPVKIVIPSDPEFIPGDLNGDGIVNITDAIELLKYVAKLDNNVVNIAGVDIDGNGTVNINDAIALLKQIAGLS